MARDLRDFPGGAAAAAAEFFAFLAFIAVWAFLACGGRAVKVLTEAGADNTISVVAVLWCVFCRHQELGGALAHLRGFLPVPT